MPTQRTPNSVLDRLAALNDSLRLRLLRVLEQEELTVGEIAEVVQHAQSTVSRHLKLLTEGGWLSRRGHKTAAFYRLVLDDLDESSARLWVTVREQMPTSAEHEEDARRLRAVLAARAGDSRTFFGRVAGEWDDIRAELFGDGFTADALLGLVPRNWVVADLGCGTGNAAELVAPIAERVIAVDRSEPMLDAARRRTAGAKNIEFRAGELEQLPLDSASVDAAVCALVLHHLDDPGPALAEMRRVLRTQRGGGVALVIDMYEHERDEYRHTMGHRRMGFSAESIERELNRAGFVDVRVRAIKPAPESKGPSLFAATGVVARNSA